MLRFLQIIFCALICKGFAISIHHDAVNLPNSRIVGGDVVFIEDYPYQVSLEMYEAHFCGGSIITNNIIITAAHCTIDLLPSMISVRAGSTARERGGILTNVKYIKNHPQYNDKTHANDIAILFLEESLEFSKEIQSIQLPNLNVDIIAGEIATVTGWGCIKENGAYSVLLEKVDIPILSDEQCKKAYGNDKITSSMICAGKTGKDACQADSGGPLVSNGTLIGIVSWGIGCARPGYPSVYTNVSSLREWIDTVVKV